VIADDGRGEQAQVATAVPHAYAQIEVGLGKCKLCGKSSTARAHLLSLNYGQPRGVR